MITTALLVSVLTFTGVTAALAGQPGAPNNTCGPSNPTTPGNAALNNGSPFNEEGQAGSVYAGNPGTKSLANSNSVHAVSQYDVACIQLSH